MDNFEIRIINQEWLETEKTENDLCSHGEFELIIGKEKILTELDSWTISTSVLQFLRCIEPNSETEKQFNPVLHCGGLLMMSCPIGVYFDLHHTDNETIIIENVIKHLDASFENYLEYPNLIVELDKKDFAIKILKIAKEVKSFFENEPKKYVEIKSYSTNENESNFFEMEKEYWKEFWKEFNELYENGIKKYNC